MECKRLFTEFNKQQLQTYLKNKFVDLINIKNTSRKTKFYRDIIHNDFIYIRNVSFKFGRSILDFIR